MQRGNHVIVSLPVAMTGELGFMREILDAGDYEHKTITNDTGEFVLIREARADDPIDIVRTPQEEE